MTISDDQLFAIGLLEICQRIHMGETGSGPSDNLEAYRDYVQRRMADWRPSLSKQWCMYDAAVYHLCVVTLDGAL